MFKSIIATMCFTIIFTVFVPMHVSWGGQAGISIKGDRIDADLSQAPLRTVLADLSNKTGIQVHIEKGLEGSVSTRFSNLLLEDGLKRILSGYSSSMIFTKAEGKIMISEIKVFEKGHSDNAALEILTASTTKKSAGQESSSAIHAAQGRSAESHLAGPGSGISGSSAGSGQAGSGMLASVSKRDNIQLARLRRDITKMRRNLGTITDDREMAKARATLSRKTSELKTRESWMQARTRGLNRLERQTAGH